MVMSTIKDIENLVIYFVEKYKWLIVIIVILFVSLMVFLSFRNYYSGYLFYPDRTRTKLYAEQRNIIFGNSRIDRINKVVEELILGPINIRYINIFPVNSKLLSSIIYNDTVILNFNKETVMDMALDKNRNVYRLFVQSVVHSVCYSDKGIKKVIFYFDGKEYKYIDNIANINEGIKPDLKILK